MATLKVCHGLVVLSDYLNPGPEGATGMAVSHWFKYSLSGQWGFFKYRMCWLPRHHFGPGYSLGACDTVKVFRKPDGPEMVV